MSTELTHTDIEQFLYHEARLLDDREFEAWLELYHEDVDYWMPAWDDNGELTEDPQREISLMYYPNRGGLEDRIFRIRTERSSATSLPEPRTGHNITNVEILETRENEVDVRHNWANYYYRYNTTDVYFGTTFLTLDTTTDAPLIKRKKIVLKNDYIHHIVDVYMV
ncbi:benzoate 1,2-dioxygenase small subunit [Corynebacterium sp. H127]|uniref:benzoate 1,2-dioxygenase small subunit n=1 Tax=Corynebacterium sp. H127 TaxID=3133418 RepID=UPI0030B7CD5C